VSRSIFGSFNVAGIGLVGVAILVWANAAAQDGFCIGHSHPWSCDNPRAPGPQASDEQLPRPRNPYPIGSVRPLV